MSYSIEKELKEGQGSKAKDGKAWSKWTLKENQTYIAFLEENRQQLNSSRGRRRKFFFRNMANRLGNGRNNEQCRSHHQKMLRACGTVANIIIRFRKMIEASQGVQQSSEVVSDKQPTTLIEKQSEQKERSPENIDDFLDEVLNLSEFNPSPSLCNSHNLHHSQSFTEFQFLESEQPQI